ncbi:MAG: protein translocase subunit SecF [Hydrotalea sp.]|nr:protein translocase subunit SecF [Hydrotalea sp.]
MWKKLRQTHHFDFVKYRPLHVGLAAAIIVISCILFFTKGLNYGIDFKGGVLLEIKTAPGVTIGDMRAATAQLPVKSYSLQEFGSPDVLLIHMDKDETSSPEALLAEAKTIYGAKVVDYRRIETVGPVVGGELKQSAIWAVLAGLVMIFIYVWLRFEWQFALGGMLSLFHDVMATLGLFSLIGLEFNLVSVAALLTIAGYSINDTVVIYDRLRENIRLTPKKPLDELINVSINATLSRTLLTSVTTFMSMVALAIFGGAAIRGFGIAMVFGIFVGTYSSIALSLPVVAYFQPKRAKGKDNKDEGYSDLFMKK